MLILSGLGLLLVSYLIGSIPTGLLVVRFMTGKDLRTIESGRTGGTNAMRAAGFLAGLATALADILKAALVVWLVRWVLPAVTHNARDWQVILVEVLAPLLATVVFIIRAASGYASWIYVVYGILGTALLAWSLRPNIQRLLAGTERLVGFRVRKTKRT